MRLFTIFKTPSWPYHRIRHVLPVAFIAGYNREHHIDGIGLIFEPDPPNEPGNCVFLDVGILAEQAIVDIVIERVVAGVHRFALR
jgi:hypothetical protein